MACQRACLMLSPLASTSETGMSCGAVMWIIGETFILLFIFLNTLLFGMWTEPPHYNGFRRCHLRYCAFSVQIPFWKLPVPTTCITALPLFLSKRMIWGLRSVLTP